MNYKKHYDLLIERGQRTLIHGYRERHHIIPRCLGGSNRKDNLVYLTAEEHYVAHLLLSKIYPEHPKLLLAINAMQMSSGNQIRNNKIFGALREKINLASKGRKHTPEEKARRAASNTGKKRTPEQRKNISEAVSGRIRSKEENAKRAAGGIGKKHSPETKERMKESAKLRWAKQKGTN